VWIEFEREDRDTPIWTGTWWGPANSQLSSSALTIRKWEIQSEGGHSVILDDPAETGGITLRTSGGQMLVLSSIGIEMEDGFGARVNLFAQ